MKVDIYIPIYIGDYLADTADLNAEEHGAYLMILMAMWRARSPLPLSRLDRVAKVIPAHWDRVWGVIGRFFDVDGDLVTQRRLMRELEASLEKKRRASDRGRKGGLARAQAQAGSEQDTSSAYDQDGGRPARLTVTLSDPSLRGSGVDHGSAPDSSQQAPQDHLAIPRVWTPYVWRLKYSTLAWCPRYGGTMIAGNTEGDRRLREYIEALSEADVLAAQDRAPEMFAEFLASGGEAAETRHCWAFFVGRWNNLRIPKPATTVGARAGPARDVRVGHAMAEVKPRVAGEVKL